MSDTTAELILTEARGHVLLVTINRPEARNSFDGATAAAMEAAMDRFEEDPELRVGIITGAGQVFSAGQDLKAAARGDMGATRRRGGFGIMAQPPNKPLIAAVEGHAVAGGLELCLSCDLIVAARDARMGIPEARHNLVAVGGALFRLPRRIPYHQLVLDEGVGVTVAREPAVPDGSAPGDQQRCDQRRVQVIGSDPSVPGQGCRQNLLELSLYAAEAGDQQGILVDPCVVGAEVCDIRSGCRLRRVRGFLGFQLQIATPRRQRVDRAVLVQEKALDLLEVARERGQGQLGLRIEVAQQRLRGDVHFSGDVLEGGSGVAPPREESLGRLDQCGPGLGLLALPK